MRTTLALVFLLFSQILISQTFTEVPTKNTFTGLDLGAAVIADLNNDGHPDILTSGGVEPYYFTELHVNDGTGNFSKIETSFEDVVLGSIAVEDINGDTYPDILIAGENNASIFVAKLYINDGVGNFTEKSGTPFPGVRLGSVAFEDVNMDDHPDILLTGENAASEAIAQLFLNDGAGNFSELAGTSFEGVRAGSVAFADINGDNAPDVLITGWNNTLTPIAKLYTNDGMGNFTESMGTPFEGVRSGAVAFSDVNGDNHPDVLLTGRNGSSEAVTRLFTNDGAGNFTEATGAPFEDVAFSAVAFADINGDTYPDVLITGKNNTSMNISEWYANDGMGNFSDMQDTILEDIYNSSVAIGDVNGDNTPDVFLMGLNTDFEDPPIARLYTNDSGGNFAEVPELPFPIVTSSSMAFSDVNGDTHPDVLITGTNSLWNPVAKLFVNDGSGNFSELQGTPFTGVENGSIAFADVNADTHPDVLLTGRNSQLTSVAELYLNDGTGNFTPVPGTPFEGVHNSAIAFEDVNGDTHPDVLITGMSNSFDEVAKMYLNDGTGNFTEMTSPPFEGVQNGAVGFADVNGDTYPDLLITGATNFTIPLLQFYINDGTGNFTEVNDPPFEAIKLGDIAFSDVNGDNAPDLVISGWPYIGPRITKLYLNDGTGDFSEMPNTPFLGTYENSIAFSDVNNDTHPDLLISGYNDSLQWISKLYINDGSGQFNELTRTSFEPAGGSEVAFSDVNGDSYPDVLISGFGNAGLITRLYINDGVASSSHNARVPAHFNIKVYPNPSADGRINLLFRTDRSSRVNLKIFGVDGRLFHQKAVWSVSGINHLPFDGSRLPRGVYFIHLENGKRKGVARFLVQ